MDVTAPPPVGSLITSRETETPSRSVADVADRFFASPGLEALALVEKGRPVGLANRNKILFFLSRRFGFELFGRDPIVEIADPAPLTVTADQPLDRVLELAMQRSYENIYDEVVVTDAGGCFAGLLSVKRLVIEQGNVLAQSLVQREVALAKASEMQKVTDLKSQFIAHVTHELRSPVNAIIGLSELLKLAAEHRRFEQFGEKLPLLAASAVSLRGIITNILDLSKIEAGRMEVHPAPVELAELVAEVAATTRVLLGSKPVTVAVEGPDSLTVVSDAIKLRQVLVNLTSNAAKFTERGAIRLQLAETENGISLAVHDTGIGIREEDLERLFVAFSQLEDPSTRRHEGTGLGLAITRQLVGLLEGEVRVASTYGRGSVFTLLLPAAITCQERAANE